MVKSTARARDFTHLAVAARPPLIPAAAGPAVTRERRGSTEQDVEDDAEAPQIAAFIINTDLLVKRLHHLGGHVLRRATLEHNVPQHVTASQYTGPQTDCWQKQ